MRRVALHAAVVVGCASGALIPVTDWSLDYGYCGAASPYLRRAALAPISAVPGDVVDVRYATSGRGSGDAVLRFADEAAWTACDVSRAATVADAKGAGGPCRNASDLACLAVERGVAVPVPANNGSLFLGAAGMHCVGGVKVRVDVGAAAAVAAGPRDVVVDGWAADFGFCGDLGAGVAAGVRRPAGIPSIVAHEGDALVFKSVRPESLA